MFEPITMPPTQRRVVSSNGVALPFDDTMFAPLRDSCDVRDDAALLRARLVADGYVYLRALLDPRAVLDLRADYFSRFDPLMLAPGTTPQQGVFSGRVPDGLPEHGTPGHPAYDLVRTPEFDAFTRTPALAAVAETLLGGPAELLPRRIVRHFHRGSARASRAHVDYDYLDQGSDRIVTAWIPVGDCPLECGGLIYLEGSHRADRAALERLRAFTDRPGDSRPISNDLGRTALAIGGRWLWADFAAGDVIFHSPHVVHASLDNTSDAMRLSVDVRFKLVGERRDERWDGDWSGDDGF